MAVVVVPSAAKLSDCRDLSVLAVTWMWSEVEQIAIEFCIDPYWIDYGCACAYMHLVRTAAISAATFSARVRRSAAAGALCVINFISPIGMHKYQVNLFVFKL